MPAHIRATDRHLAGIDYRLADLVRKAIDLAAPSLRIVVVEGRRPEAVQAELVRLGAARSERSPHCLGLGVRLAVIIERQLRADWPLLCLVAGAMRDAARELRVDVRWGWTWRLVSALPAVIDHRVGPGASYSDAQGFVVVGG